MEEKKDHIGKQVLIFGGVLISSLLFQTFIGDFSFSLFRFPVNLLIVVLLTLLAAFRKSNFVKTLSNGYLSVFLLISLTLIAVLAGSIPNNRLLSSWTFTMCYVFTIVNLVSIIFVRTTKFSFKDYAFYLNHLGVSLLLITAGFGFADKQKYLMKVDVGSSENIAYLRSSGAEVTIPLNIDLIDFNVQYYPVDSSLFSKNQPKSFTSKVNLQLKSGESRTGKVSVNSPLEIGFWTIYQYSYDQQKGRHSKYSIFEIVYDPWKKWIYISIFIVFAGAISLFMGGVKND